MTGTTYEIVEKRRSIYYDITRITDFELAESGQIAAEEILRNPHITLYCFDFDNGQAVFVETPSDINLSQAPFYYIAQYEHALRVITVPLATMMQMAQSITLDDERLIMIHSVGRAGSTLASQILAQVDGVINISEPDALSWLVGIRFLQPDNEAGLKALLDATIRLLCKTPAQTAWVIKGRSWVIELGDWLHQLYPQTKNLFLYREVESYLASLARVAYAAFGGVERSGVEQQANEKEFRQAFALVTPLIAQYDPDTHLPGHEVGTLMWLSVMERALFLYEMGIEMLAIRYESWHSAPQETAVAMLEYCGLRPDDMTAVYETLTKDSQAGTAFSQESTQHNEFVMKAEDLERVHHHLQNHPTIQTADFEMPNTLKL
jgi:hypothetical protein